MAYGALFRNFKLLTNKSKHKQVASYEDRLSGAQCLFFPAELCRYSCKWFCMCIDVCLTGPIT